MHRIYSNASFVLVWLGEGDSNTQGFFDFVNKGSWTSEFFIRHGERLLDLSLFRITDPEPEEVLILRGIWKLIRNRYWSRSWIVQELLLAKRIEIMMGSRRIDWSTFFRAMDIQEHAGFAESRAGGQRMAHVRLARDNPDGMTAPTNLEGLITYFSKQECSDPRDRVYSMLGIANERDDFAVDYDRTLEQVIEYTLGRIKIENFLFAPEIVKSFDISPSEVSTRFSATFLDKKFDDGQTAQYVDVEVVQTDKAETSVGVPIEWKLPTRRSHLVLSSCACVACSSKGSHLVPRHGDIVTEFPRSALIVLCRPKAERTSFEYIGCLGQDHRSESRRSRRYLCFAPDDDLGELSATRITANRSADNNGCQMLEWKLSWRTAFAISKHA